MSKETKRLNIKNIPISLHDDIKAIAENNGLTISATVRVLLKRAVEKGVL